jgi:hypothetical protein
MDPSNFDSTSGSLIDLGALECLPLVPCRCRMEDQVGRCLPVITISRKDIYHALYLLFSLSTYLARRLWPARLYHTLFSVLGLGIGLIAHGVHTHTLTRYDSFQAYTCHNPALRVNLREIKI